MRKLAAVLCLVTACYVAGAAAASPPAVQGSAWIVEYGDGQVLASSNADAHRAIASITKLMTVLVVLDHHNLTDTITVAPGVSSVGQESIALQTGEQLSVADLIRGALIQSANDAAVALALGTSPNLTAFANLMNAKARELGLRDSHFVRPDGLDAAGEYSTAADVTRLARAAMKVPFVRDTVARSTANIGGGRVLHTWNDLLGSVPGVIGVKTGHTDEAGWSQVLADREGQTTVYATILGSPSRDQRNADLERLASWGLGLYTILEPVVGHHPYATAALPYGRAPLELVAGRPLRVYVRPGRILTQKIVAPRSISLPVSRGQSIGRIEIWQGKRLLGSRELVASRSVARPGIAGRAGYYARRTVHDIRGLIS